MTLASIDVNLYIKLVTNIIYLPYNKHEEIIGLTILHASKR